MGGGECRQLKPGTGFKHASWAIEKLFEFTLSTRDVLPANPFSKQRLLNSMLTSVKLM